jgi:hypothetical protein
MRSVRKFLRQWGLSACKDPPPTPAPPTLAVLGQEERRIDVTRNERRRTPWDYLKD